MKLYGFLLVLQLCCISYGCAQSAAQSNQPLESTLAWPAVADGQEVYVHTGFASLYNRETLIPDWVAYQLTADEVNPSEKLRERESFQWDPNTKGKQTAYREE